MVRRWEIGTHYKRNIFCGIMISVDLWPSRHFSLYIVKRQKSRVQSGISNCQGGGDPLENTSHCWNMYFGACAKRFWDEMDLGWLWKPLSVYAHNVCQKVIYSDSGDTASHTSGEPNEKVWNNLFVTWWGILIQLQTNKNELIWTTGWSKMSNSSDVTPDWLW